jgi:hypothetical protein
MKTLLSNACPICLVLISVSLHAQTYGWQVRRSPVDEHLYDVTYAKGMYVAVGNHRTILTSENGADWRVRAQNPASQGWLSSVVWGNGVFVAVGNGYQRQWPLSSPSTFGPPGSAGYSLDTNSAAIVVSRDGIHWRGLLRGRPTLNAVAFGKNRFVAVGLGGIITSRDGHSWSYPTNFHDSFGRQRTPGDVLSHLAPHFPTQVAYGNGTFIVLGQVGSVLASTNGLDWVGYGLNAVDWHVTGNAIFNGMHPLVFNGSMFIAAPFEGPRPPELFASRRGARWQQIASPSFYMALGHGPEQATAGVGWDTQRRPVVQISPDGLDWSGSPTQIKGSPYAIGYGPRGYVIVGAKGLILQSVLPRTLRP